MIFYLSNYVLDEVISELIEENELKLLNKVIVDKVNFEHFIKQQANVLQSTSIFLIDTGCLSNSDEELISTLSSTRLLYDDCRIIVIVNDLNNPMLLSNIFNLGIYDIIVKNDSQSVDDEIINLSHLKQKLKKALVTGYTYGDSVKYRVADNVKGNTKGTVKEKIVVQKEIKRSVDKAMIGFMGMQSRIGTTHNTLLSAFYLKKQGYKVAVLESSTVKEKTFQDISEYTSDVIVKSDCFEIHGLDFYANYNLDEIHKILIKNYNFVIIDFGEFEVDKLVEFNRCVIPIIVTGSKAWELQKIFPLFDAVQEEELKEYTYLFSFTDNIMAKNVIENMEELKKVFFMEYFPSMFETPESEVYSKIFAEYIKQPNDKKSKGSILSDIFKKKK